MLNDLPDRQPYAGNGVTTVFAVPFYFLKDAHIVAVLVDNVTRAETPWALGVNYTLTGAGDQNAGGALTALAAPAAGKTLVIYRDPDLAQNTDYTNNEKRPGPDLEDSVDKLTMLVKRLKTRVDRALRLPEGFTATFSTFLPSILTAGKTLIVNPTADGLILGPTADDIANAQTYANNAATSAANSANSAATAAASAAAVAAGIPTVVGSRAAPTNVVAVNGILFTSTSWRTTNFVQGSGGAVVISAAARIQAGNSVGQVLVLIGRSDANSIQIPDGNGVSTRGQTIQLQADTVAEFIWDGTNWVINN